MKTKTNQSLIVCTVIIFIVTILGTINLSEQRKYESSIFTAAIHGKENSIKEFVKSGANIDSQDEYGATPLHYSLQAGHTEISKFLVISEASVNIMDKDGLTHLDWAHWMNQTEMANLIRKYGGKKAEQLNNEEKRTKALIKINYNLVILFNISHLRHHF